MGEENEKDDPIARAIEFGTIETTNLFDRGNPSFKFSAQGLINIRIPWSTIAWGILFGLSFFLIVNTFFNTVFSIGIFTMPVLLAGTIFSTILGAKIGGWSPISKETGEDLASYIIFAIRRKVALGGFGQGKQSVAYKFTKAVGTKGRIMKCDRWMGTQPLRGAPPQSPYKGEDVFPYDIYPIGELKTVPSSLFNDGLGERF